MKYDKAELVEIEGPQAGSQVRRLWLHHPPTNVPLLPLLAEVCVEEAQEDVQGADKSAGD